MSLIRFKKDPLPPFLLLFPSFGCATALFQYGEVKRILSISFSLIERNDNSTCVNSIQNKKNKKKGNKREEDRVDFTSEIVRSLRWGKKKHFPRYCSRLFSLLVETSLLWNDTFESNRSWGTNVAKLVGWKRSGNWSWRARDFFADECKIWPVEQISNRMTKIYQFSHLTIFLAKYYYYVRNIITQSLNY